MSLTTKTPSLSRASHTVTGIIEDFSATSWVLRKFNRCDLEGHLKSSGQTNDASAN